MQKQHAQIQSKYDAVLEKAVKRFSKRQSVIAILVTGSYARGALHTNSDLDLLLLTATDEPHHQEQRYEIDGIIVECLTIPLAVAQSAVRNERNGGKRFFTRLLADAKIVVGESYKAAKLIKLAKRIDAAPTPQLTKKERADLLFFLEKSPEKERLLKLCNKPIAAQLRMNHKLAVCLETGFRLERMATPHHKDWDAALHKFKDRKLARLIKQAALTSDQEKRERFWSDLVQYVTRRLQEHT